MVERGEPAAAAGDRLVPSGRLKAVPILVALCFGCGLPLIAVEFASAATALFWPSAKTGDHLLAGLFLHHGAQAVLALAAIALLKGRMAADFGLRLPERWGAVGAAVLWSLLIFALFTAIAYLPNLVSGAPPAPTHPLTVSSVAGWVAFEGVFVGPTEEILFRSLLIGYLAAAMPGALRLGPVSVSWAALVSSAVFALGHIDAIWWQTAFHMTYAFTLGLVYAYWFERTRSLVAPALAHNATDLAATLTGFAVSAFWR